MQLISPYKNPLPLSLAFLCFGILGFSFILAHFLHLTPCFFCKLERILYGAVGFFALVFSAVKGPYEKKRFIFFFWLFSLSLLASVSLYHVGVEQHFFPAPHFCEKITPQFSDIQSLRTYLETKQVVTNCSPLNPFTVLGFSLAEINFLIACALTAFVIFYFFSYVQKDAYVKKNY